MTKTQRCLDALMAIGRPATAREVSEATGISIGIVSGLFCSWQKRQTCHISADFIYGKYGKKIGLFSIQRLRPIRLEEVPWHQQKIAEYGLSKWAEIVNRDPADLIKKLKEIV